MSHEVQTGADAPSVRLEGVTKRFGDFAAVRDMDLDIPRGQFFTMLGPSGCGKTTTLRMVAGFEEPTEGRVLLDGDDVTGLPAFRRPTNTVFQSYALFPHRTVEQNVAFGLQRQKVDKDEIKRRVGEELERVGLAPEAKRKPRAALRRPAAARRPRARAREPARRAAPRRAAGRARPEAPQAAAGGAQAHPARRRHHVHLRDARPGGGAHDVGPHRGDEPRRRRAGRPIPRRSTSAPPPPSSPASSACRTSCRARSSRPTAAARSCAWTRGRRCARLSPAARSRASARTRSCAPRSSC